MKLSSLQKAFRKINKLNLSITLDQRLELNQILCDLSKVSYREGSDMVNKIHEKYT